MFHTTLGKIIKTKEKRQKKNDNLLLKKTPLIFLSKIIKKIVQMKKYIAAYFAKKAKPRKVPSKINLQKSGLFLIFNNCNKDRDQNKISKTSVDSKKEDTDTPGIKKKVIAA